MSSDAPTNQQGFKDVIVTLPVWGISVIAGLCFCSLALAVGLVLLSDSDNVKGYAVQLLLVLVPLGSAVIAGIAIRRTSTRQIDRMVAGFLEKTLLERFQIHCNSSSDMGLGTYPFHAVKLRQPCRGTSYAAYELQWRPRGDRMSYPPARINVKCNVFNFELFSQLPVQTDPSVDAANLPNVIVNAGNVRELVSHPVLGHFMSVLQGSVNEGYEAHVSFEPQPERQRVWMMHFSLRQKLRENFLTSPFLKRYFAEDAAIATGVLCREWLAVQATDAAVARQR
jgi:hypothetical protein